MLWDGLDYLAKPSRAGNNLKFVVGYLMSPLKKFKKPAHVVGDLLCFSCVVRSMVSLGKSCGMTEIR